MIFDDCFVVSDIKIIQGASGLFVSMPSKRRTNGTFRDIAHPLNTETRRKIEETIIARYRETVAEMGGGVIGEMRSLAASGDDSDEHWGDRAGDGDLNSSDSR